MTTSTTDLPVPATPGLSGSPPQLRYAVGVALFLAVYYATARLGLLMDPVGGVATSVWPPAGISLAVLCLFGYRFWPGVALGALLINLTAGAPLLAACGMATGNTLEALLGTFLLKRFTGFRGSLDNIRGAVGFILLAAGLSTTVGATIGVASGWLGGIIPAASLREAWLTWWLGDAMGDLIWAPLLFAFSERPRFRLTPWLPLEAGALLASLVTVCLLVFGILTPVESIFLQPYVLFPLLIWAALRFFHQGTSTAMLVVAAMAVWRTAEGLGPFTRETLNGSLLFLQAFLGALAVTMLLFAAGVSERKRAEKRLKVNYSVARVLAASPTLEMAIPDILRAICLSLDWDCGNVWRVEEQEAALRLDATWHRSGIRLGRFGDLAPDLKFRRGVGMAGRVWNEARPVWVPDLAREKGFVRRAAAGELGLRSAMGLPILAGEETLGVMTFFSRKVQQPDRTLLQTLSTVGDQIGQFVERRKAEEGLRRTLEDLETRIARRTRQLSEANRIMRQEIGERRRAEESLRQLSTRLLRVQDEERQRIARALHDSTGQDLAALSMNLAVVQGEGSVLNRRGQSALDESRDLVERCSREIRSLSYLLHPPLLEEVGLPAAVRWCAEGFARRSGIQVDLEISSDFGRLPLELENALFRIVQECLTNVQRHSGSSSARIRLSRRLRRVALEVKDRGMGIPREVLSGRDGVEHLGLGLLGMRERVRQLGGEIRIDSSRSGAKVRVEMEIPRMEA